MKLSEYVNKQKTNTSVAADTTPETKAGKKLSDYIAENDVKPATNPQAKVTKAKAVPTPLMNALSTGKTAGIATNKNTSYKPIPIYYEKDLAKAAQNRANATPYDNSPQAQIDTTNKIITHKITPLNPVRNDFLNGVEYTAGNVRAGAVGMTKGIVNELSYLGQGAAQGAYANEAAVLKMRDAGKPVQSPMTTQMQETATKLSSEPLTKAVDWGEDYARTLSSYGYDNNGIMKTIGNVAQGVGGMIPSIVSNFIVPGSSLYVMATGAAGNATEQAVAGGASTGAALAYGAVIGVTEAATEKMFDGLGGTFGVGLADDVLKSLVKKVSSNVTTQKVMLALANTLGEGFEEWITEYAEAYENKLLINQDSRSFGQISSDALYSGAIGSLTSIVMQGASISKLSAQDMGEQAANDTIAKMNTGKPNGTLQPSISSTNAKNTAPTVENNVQVVPNNMQNLGQNVQKTVDNQTDIATPVVPNVRNNLVPNLPTMSQQAVQAPTSDFKPQVATDTAKAVEVDTAEQAKPEVQINADLGVQNKITPNLPQGTGAKSAEFVPEQKVSEFYSNTLKNTDTITEEQKANLNERDYVFDSVSEKQSKQIADQRIEADFDGEVEALSKANTYTAAEDVDTAMGILEKFSDNNYGEKMASWSRNMYKKVHGIAVSLQALDKYSRTPEGAVIKAQGIIDEAVRKLTTKKEFGKEVDKPVGRKIKTDSENAKKAVKESANESANATDPANVAVEWWIRDTSKKLSEKIEANSKDGGTRTDTTMQTMLKDLVRITSGAAPQGTATKIKTNLATNTLRNYWANSEQYQGAVARAQRYINEKYSNDPEALEAFNDWLSGSGINTWAALGKALQENGVKYNDILMSSWQDKTELLDKVTAKILADTDLTAEESASAAQAISDKFYDELAIRAQKKIEQLLKPSTPKQQKTMYQRVNEFINSGVFSDDAIIELVNAKYGIPSLTAADVQKIYELNKLAQETDNDYQKRAYLNQAARVITDKMPVSGKEKVFAIRRIAMLLNPKTLISRNAGGNVVFGLFENIKDAPATLIDIAVSKKTGTRTTSYNPFATAKAEFLGAKKGLTEWGKDIKNNVDTSPTEHEMPRSSALKSKVGAGTEKVLYKLLQLGDRPFYEAAYAKRIDELKRLGLDYTSEDANGQAMTYALDKVFQNNSELAKKAMQLRDSLGVIGDIAIPFAQTPANIFDKLADYSPYGYVRAIKRAGTIKDSAWSQKQFVDTLSRSMTGTGILAFAFFAAKSGLITGGDNKEEDEALSYQKKISGWQPYSIVVGDKSYTYDWATVVGALLSLGADISKSDDAGETLSAILSAGAKAGINTMFNQSYMEGIAELFGGEDIASGLESMLIGLPASFTPTAFQQIAKLIDPIARDTYDSNPLKRAWNKVKVKIPYLSQTLPAKISASGQPLTNLQGSKLSNAFESVLSPGYIGETQKTAIDTEMQRLSEATGTTEVLPNWSEYTSKSDLSFSGNGTTYTMSAKEWEQFQKTRGQTTYKELDKLTKSTEYKNMTDEDKAKAVTDVYSQATYNARQTIVEARGEMYIPTADAGAKIEKYQSAGITQKQAYSVYKTFEALKPEQGEKEVSTYQKISAISGMGYTDKQAIALAGTLYTSSDKESMLPYLTTSKHLLSLYLTNKDSEMISMTIPSSVTKDKVEYELTDKEKGAFRNVYANYFNSRVTNISTAAQVKSLRDKAYEAAKLAVIQSR